MIYIPLKRIAFISFIICIICGCSQKRTIPDISKIDVKPKILRFEKDLFATDFEHISDSIPFFQKKYGEFFNIFNYKILQIGSTENPAYSILLKGFVTDFNINKVIKATDTTFTDFDNYADQLTEAFKYYKYYFPKMPTPTIVTYISGFNQTMVSTDTLLGIGLDKYLGADCEFYKRMQMSKFMTANMYKQKLPSDAMRAWAMTQFPLSDSSSNLLSNIIYLGKLVYFTKAVIPSAPDSIVFGLNTKQLSWCTNFEERMWTFLVEYKMLFKTDYMTINKFVGEAPFTKDFGQNSPGKAVMWTGWKIVNSYMNNHTEVSLENLMKENDCQKILRLSKYKPN